LNRKLLPLSNTAMHLSRPRPALLPKVFRFISYLRPGDGER
jgi:hypothetical protein